jgi:hypothetical protein
MISIRSQHNREIAEGESLVMSNAATVDRLYSMGWPAFAPSPQEIARAQKAIEAMNQADASGFGAANHGGVMLDAATTRMFQGVLDRAALIDGRNE